MGRRAIERLQAAARHFPGDLLAALEVRLSSNSGDVDLSVRLLHPSPAVANLVPPPLQQLLLQTGDSSPVSSLWLELDLDDRTSRELPVPLLAAGLRGDADAGWVADSLLPALHGSPLGAAQRRLVLRCLNGIPAPGKLLYVFSLSSRGEGAVRLEISGLEPASILDYLEAQAPHTVGPVSEVAPLFEGVERIHLSFDIGEEVSPRIGIEGSFLRLPYREPRWAELFERLVERGLCLPAKRDAALAWPGYDSLRTAPDRWPAGAGPRNVCVRSLSHVKVVSRPDREPEAKVYLLVTPLVRPPARRQPQDLA